MLLRTMSNVVRTAMRYILKAKKIVNQLTKTAKFAVVFSLQLTLFLLIISLLPTVIAVAVLYFFVIERGAAERLGKVRLFGLALLLALIHGAVFAAMDFLLSLELDIILLKVILSSFCGFFFFCGYLSF